MFVKIIDRASQRLHKLLFHPIRVYCVHHICKQFESDWMYECDWMPIELFQRKVLELKKSGIIFVSLTEAYQRICTKRIRLKKYAVITFDDGYSTLKEVLPWLEKHSIPLTLFVNPDYAAKKAYRESAKEQYLTTNELANIKAEIGMHGLQHVDCSIMNEIEFHAFAEDSIQQTININQSAFIPFWAYTWGRHNAMTDQVLRKKDIVPVYIDGQRNYCDVNCIHRELL